jgi:predicted CXXCH cytochrome family protein
MDKAAKTILVLVLLSAAGWAQEHPVPLEKNADAATCLQCHEDKSQGKHVHSAIAMGCTACHEVKTENDTTTITFVAPKNELCFTCHANEAKPEDSKHGPWERGECVFCHDPHTSDYPKQLRAEGNALCLQCHDARKGPVPEKFMLFGKVEGTRADLTGLRRLRLDADNTRGHPLGNHWVANIPDYTRPGQKMGCLTCHVPHFSPEDKLARVITEKDKSGKEVKVDACYACHTELDKRAAEERIRMVPQVEKEIRQQQADVQKKREEYLKKLPKLAGDDRDKQ